MAGDGSEPFRLGALDPMLGDDAGSECGGAEEYSVGLVPTLWPSPFDHGGVQEYTPDSAIDPILLQQDSQELHCSATEAAVSTEEETNPHSLNQT